MPPPSKPPTRLANWRTDWLDRTTAGRDAMTRLVALLPLTHATIRRRLSAARPGATVRDALGSSWPTDLDDLTLTVAEAKRHDLAAGLAALAGAPDGSIALGVPRAALSTAQRVVFDKAVSLSPRSRFPTCGAFVDALRRAKG